MLCDCRHAKAGGSISSFRSMGMVRKGLSMRGLEPPGEELDWSFPTRCWFQKESITILEYLFQGTQANGGKGLWALRGLSCLLESRCYLAHTSLAASARGPAKTSAYPPSPTNIEAHWLACCLASRDP